MQTVLSYHNHVQLAVMLHIPATTIALSVPVAFIVTQQARRSVQRVKLGLMPHILATVIGFSA